MRRNAKGPGCEPGPSENRASRSCRGDKFLAQAAQTVKRLALLWRFTFASGIGMFHNRRAKAWGLVVDRLTISLEEVSR